MLIKYIQCGLSKKAVEQSSNINVHLSALKQMPAIIRTAILKERTADKENNIDIKEIRRFYNAIHYENQIYPVKITIKVYKTEVSKAYSYEIKNPADTRQGSIIPLRYIEDLTPPTDD